jgi:ubiquinone/menaquinone biosynthesis C-methylase UbiE
MASTYRGPASAPDPQALMQMNFSFTPSMVLTSGVQLGVFSQIAEGRNTAPEIARAIGATERGVRMLMDALTGIELLRKVDGAYELTPLAEEFLVRGKPSYMGAMMEQNRSQVLDPWLHLTEVIRTGKPPHAVEQQKTAEEFFPSLVRTLHITNREPARRTAAVLSAGTEKKGLHVLDVACGSGVWGIAIAEADREARITAQDYPGMLPITREYVKRHGVEERYEFLPGDLKDVDLGEARFDVTLLGNIVHSEGERSSRDLFRRLARALKPDGRVAVIDMVPNDERSGPPFPLMFALNMLVHTAEGDTYTLAQYRAWLQEAGFPKVETADIGSHSPLIVASKK